jgi:hypothetical protein
MLASSAFVITTQSLYNTFIMDNKFVGERFDAAERTFLIHLTFLMAAGGWLVGVYKWHAPK